MAPESDAPVDQLRGPRDDEQCPPYCSIFDIDAPAGILDREIAQAEPRPHARELGAGCRARSTHAWPGRFDHSPASSMATSRTRRPP
jgi:hypothetical protein